MVHGPRNPDFASTPAREISEPPLVENTLGGADLEDDPDLRAAIEASLREANAPRPSAPVVDEPETYLSPTLASASLGFQVRVIALAASHPFANDFLVQPLPNYDLNDQESDAIMTFSQTVEAAQSRGTSDLVRNKGVGDLYHHTSTMKPKLQRSLDDAGRRQRQCLQTLPLFPIDAISVSRNIG
jgi:growth factor-regulated tyrosine kinase substrate